ncbi:MAG: hypothetical protein IJY25_01045 [Bacilli bacterium]|nr:hypothetical protein [Bacilli bacterium]
MNELQEFIENLDLETNNYYYHITGKGFGDEIIEEGLSLEDRNLNSTTIEVPIEMLNDPVSYCTGEYSNSTVKRQEMVIIGCEKGEEEYIVTKAYQPKWMGDQRLDYLVPNEYVLGYIDLETLEVIYNFDYKYGGRYV